ncbi:7-deoxyloganetic acid glucosyltransferase-like [Euphorbia lathyris]|uniref:7-deoxyloganetic acid glucosyltransferase-like n=1 Tax=Euphorbia lathyris TaxID=212925 RepID=UPI003313C158
MWLLCHCLPKNIIYIYDHTLFLLLVNCFPPRKRKMNQGTISPFVPHVLIFPAPGQGHVNSMLKLAEVLYLSGLHHITFLNFEFMYKNLTDVESRFTSKYPGFQFKTIPDSFSIDDGPTDPAEWLREALDASKKTGKPNFKKFLIEFNPPVTYIIGDMAMSFIHDVAIEVGIPSIQFHTISACCMWVLHCVPDIVAANQLPIKGEEDMDRLITAVPGMETILRCRDLPKKFCQVNDINHPHLLMLTNEMREAESLILNTFEELEGPILSQIRTRYPKTYAIGPIHQLLKTKLESSHSNSIWQVDRSCMEWLDKQPLESVLYISFGSISLMTRDQIMELWYGLANSNHRFLWVMRHGSLLDENGNVLENIPTELEVGLKERGYVVSWAPQEEVLGHKAIGGFWTHSGWNSTLESIVAGVPMLCLPYYADQQVNSRFVSEVWKMGLDMKDTCDRKIVEKMVNDLMVDRRDEFVKSAAKMAKLARNSVQEGGSSSGNLNSLIEEIKKLSMK